MKRIFDVIVLMACLVMGSGTASGEIAEGVEQFPSVHSFGHVGIDYNLACDFLIVNHRPDTITISELVPDCDCTILWVFDSTLAPGDTTIIHSTFSTKDYYGPTGRPFSIYFKEPKTPTLVYWHRAIVGQWIFGLKPDPISLFFLPPHESHKVQVHNDDHESISVELHHQVDTLFDVNIIENEASRGESLEIEVVPRTTLAKGTYHSNFSLRVIVEGGSTPAVLTVPVKIVRY